MKPSTHTLLIFACIAVTGSLLWAWRSWNAAHDADKKYAKIFAQNAALITRLQQLGAETAPPRNTTASAQSGESAASQAPAPKRESTLERLTRQSAESALNAERQKKDPELQRKYFVARRVDLSIVYGPFFHKANLPPDVSEKLTDILARREEFETDLTAIKNTEPARRTDPIWQELLRESRKEADDAALAVLGDDGFAQFQLYEREKFAWGHAGNVAAGLALADMPMSFEQSEQLAKIMANASSSYLKGKTANLSEIDWNVVDAEARKILTPGQFDLFSTTQFIGGANIQGGGGFSRWSAEFSKAFSDAIQSRPQTQ